MTARDRDPRARPTVPAEASRRPVWSGPLTSKIAPLVPGRRRRAALNVIKAVHSAIFFSVAALIVLFAWDGVRQRQSRRTGIAAGIAVAESAIFASNNLVCPLTPLAEELGASSGSVTDIFLPDWISRRIPLVAGTVLVVGLLLNARAWKTTDRPG